MIKTDFPRLLRALSDAGVEFIVVGGAAATAHGSPRLTLDLDVVYRRTRENIDRVIAAFSEHSPYPRGAPPGLPFQWDRRTLEFGSNFTLVTDLGFIDLLGEITGGGDYEALRQRSILIDLYGVRCLCVDLETLVQTKRAAGRPKDFEALAELELVRNELKQNKP